MVAMSAREEYPAAAVLAVLQMHFVLFQSIPIGLADFGGVGQGFVPSAGHKTAPYGQGGLLKGYLGENLD